MTPHVRRLVGWLVGRSVSHNLQGGKLHFHAAIRALIFYYNGNVKILQSFFYFLFSRSVPVIAA